MPMNESQIIVKTRRTEQIIAVARQACLWWKYDAHAGRIVLNTAVVLVEI